MNQQTVLRTLTFLLCLAASACGFNQDPLKGMPEEIRKAAPPGTDTEKPRSFDASQVVFEMPELVTLQEGVNTTFNIKLRILEPDFDGVIVIDNLDHFEGATFDAATGDFNWTPPFGTTQRQPYQKFELRVLGGAIDTRTKSRQPSAVVPKSISLIVASNPQAPMITVSEFPSAMRESVVVKAADPEDRLMKVVEFTVEVVDPQSDAKSGERPRVILNPPASGFSLSAFTQQTSARYDASKKAWVFRFKTEFNAQVTDSVRSYSMVVQAVNSFGQSSLTWPIQTRVFTQLRDAETTWMQDKVLDPSLERQIEFTVFNPDREGKISLVEASVKVPFGSQLRCSEDGYKLNCRFLFLKPIPVPKPPPGKKDLLNKTRYIEFSTVTKNNEKSDAVVNRTSFRLNFDEVAK